ncbi:hypothetical protein DVH05_006135 [Phytophthora capsici]|nr:hypothetical protein DVH05_006135 [Phytophthora capsici]
MHSKVWNPNATPRLLTCKVERYMLGATIAVNVDASEKHLEVAEKLGVTHVVRSGHLTPQETAEEIIARFGLGDVLSVVIEASVYPAGTSRTYTQGWTDVKFPIGVLCGKERFMTGNLRLAAGNHRLTLGVIVSGSLSVKEFVSESVPFEKAKHAFDSVNRGNGDRRGWQVLFKVRFQGENKALHVREDLVHCAAGCAAHEEDSRSLFGPEHLAGRGCQRARVEPSKILGGMQQPCSVETIGASDNVQKRIHEKDKILFNSNYYSFSTLSGQD